MRVAIIGLGLIGGSLALLLKEKGLVSLVTGVESNPLHARKALTLGIADEIAAWEQAVAGSDMIVLCVPADVCARMLPGILDQVKDQVVWDTASVKEKIVSAVTGHPKRAQYVATHPMWGTELNGPEAATLQAFKGRATVICNALESSEEALALVLRLYEALGMYPVYMNAAGHDLHVAYISHISHVTSFALANTVLEKEAEEDTIFAMASGGFESTVRLAASSPDMWVPILKENREHILDVLEEHIVQLSRFKTCLDTRDWQGLRDMMNRANGIKRILKGKVPGTPGAVT